MARTVLFSASLGAVAGLQGSPVTAESASSTIAVSLVVEPSCGVSATPAAFAGRTGEPMDAVSRIEVSCNDVTPVEVRLDRGLNGDGANRRLAGDAGYVSYAIYSDAARSLAWHPGLAQTAQAGFGSLSLSAYGRIDAGATRQAAGSYRDTITVTVDF
ncbi:Csu type fimbrial protein [Tsuneonella sp. HG249]